MDVFLFSVTAAAALYQCRKSNESVITAHTELTAAEISLRFPSLVEFTKTKTPLVGLLFAAAWCGDCQKDVPIIEKAISSAVNEGTIVVYVVSSDNTEQEMKDFCRSSSFTPIPFENESERTELKRFFQTCAKIEQDKIGMKNRKHGIPALLIFERTTGRILTEEGVENCIRNASSPGAVVAAWKRQLQPTIQIENSMDIKASSKLVWAVTEDVERWPEWSPIMTRVKRLDSGPFAVGSQARIEQTGLAPAVWTVVTMERGQSFSWSTCLWGITMTGTHEVYELGDHFTKSVLRIELTGRGLGVVSPIVRFIIKQSLAEENRSLRKRCESYN